MRKTFLVIVSGIGLLGLAQVVPVPHGNPTTRSDFKISEPAGAVLRASCYDCHSNETRWTWYSRVAPLSWMLSFDVHEGRDDLNFSRWSRLTPQERNDLLARSQEEIRQGEMPPLRYTLFHPEAKLTPERKKVLLDWIQSATQENHRGE